MPRYAQPSQSHRQLLRRPGLAEPDHNSIGGNQKSHWAISSATWLVRDAGSGGK